MSRTKKAVEMVEFFLQWSFIVPGIFLCHILPVVSRTAQMTDQETTYLGTKKHVGKLKDVPEDPKKPRHKGRILLGLFMFPANDHPEARVSWYL